MLHYIRLSRFAYNKHSSLLDQFVSYEENEVLWIQPQMPVSAARWQHGSQICFATFLAKNHQIAKNSTITKAMEKISTDYRSIEFWEFLYACLTKFKNNQILLNKISHRILLTIKLFKVGLLNIQVGLKQENKVWPNT